MKIFVFGSSLTSSYWNGAATYYRGVYSALAALRHELIRLGARFEQRTDGSLRVLLAGRSAAELVQALTTPLTVLRTQQASLEDVYLRILADDGA